MCGISPIQTIKVGSVNGFHLYSSEDTKQWNDTQYVLCHFPIYAWVVVSILRTNSVISYCPFQIFPDYRT